MALFPQTVTGQQMNYLFAYANYTMALALLMDALPGFKRLLYLPASSQTAETYPCPALPMQKVWISSG